MSRPHFDILADNNSIASETRDNFIQLPDSIVKLGQYRIRPKTPQYKSPYKAWSIEVMRRESEQEVMPLPWMTYRSIIWMLCNIAPGDTMFEWGGGLSTSFWRNRGVDVTTIECNAAWAEKLGGNVRCIAKMEQEYINTLDKMHDVIVIDGARRPECFVHAMQFTRKFIVLDNSNWPEHKFLHDNLAPGWSVHLLGGPGANPSVHARGHSWMTSVFIPPGPGVT